MKKIKQSLLLILLLSLSNIFAQTSILNNKLIIENWLISEAIDLKMPIFNNPHDVNGNEFTFKELLKFDHIDKAALWPSEGEAVNLNGKISKWKLVKSDNDDLLMISKSKKIKNLQVYYSLTYVEVDRWLKANLILKSAYAFEVLLDGESLGTKTSLDGIENVFEKEIKLEQGKHIILVKSLVKEGLDQDLNIHAQLVVDKPADVSSLILSTSNKRRMNIPDVLDGMRVNSSTISPNGNYYIVSLSERYAPEGKSNSWYDIYEIANNKKITSFKGSDIWGLKWIPNSDKVSYMTEALSGTKIVEYDFVNGFQKNLLNDIKHLGSYYWAPNSKYFIYSISESPENTNKLVKKVEGMADRWPWYRSRSFLYKYDIASNFSERITFGNKSTDLHDISPDSKYLLFSESINDYSERPYTKQKLFLLDLQTFQASLVWNKKFSASATFSPDGKDLLVLGGPATFGDSGISTYNGQIPNDYDQQAFILNLDTKAVNPITKFFNPAIKSAHWNRLDNQIYFICYDQSYVNLYRYNLKSEDFSEIELGMDIIKNMSFSSNELMATYTANGIKNRDQAYLLDLKSHEYTLVLDPEKENFEDVLFGNHEDWVFTTKEGVKIDGRIYYPPNFDPNKKYPLIVNYYAGTSPTSRSFRGRYPLNLYAAGDYIVYNLLPSGTFGYGQDFSAAHVNNWGTTVADEIIDATNQFTKEHEFINDKKIGCIGASYGGFMTMLLMTRTDIFTCGISHAGISSISSYWGEGYWGYSYSAVASANSFPWNNKRLYIEQSALFNADKIKNPLLLLHGDSDTNVPLGESIQLYTALKMLGSPVDFIEFKGQDHHILDYKKRIYWQKTIAAYFDRWLKDESEWWNELYPKPNF